VQVRKKTSSLVSIAGLRRALWMGADPPRHKPQITCRNLKIGEVTLRARSDPQCDSTVARLDLHIVNDETGLLRSMHIKPRFASLHLNLELGPDTGLQVNI